MKIIPLSILVICLIGIIFGFFVWISEIRKNSPIQKAKFWWNFLLHNQDLNIEFKTPKRLRMQHPSSITVQNLNEQTQPFDVFNYPSQSVLNGIISESENSTARKTDVPFFRSQNLNVQNQPNYPRIKKARDPQQTSSQLIISQENPNQHTIIHFNAGMEVDEISLD